MSNIEMVTPISIESIDHAKHRIDVRFSSEAPESEELEQLINSIKQSGVIEPIIIRPKGARRYEVVAGNRRLRAARAARLESIPAIVRDLTDEQAIRIAYIENVHRKNLEPIQKAKGIAAVYNLIDIPKDKAIVYVKALWNKREDEISHCLPKIDAKTFNVETSRKFVDAFKEIAFSANTQYQLLQLVVELPEQIQEKIQEKKINQGKATLLTHTLLRQYPEVQELLADQIKDKTLGQSATIVRQAIKDIQDQAIYRQEDGHLVFGQHATTQPEIDTTFDVRWLDLANLSDKVIAKFLGRQIARGESGFYDEKVYMPLIEKLKRNLETLSTRDRKSLALHVGVLALICKAIMDAAK